MTQTKTTNEIKQLRVADLVFGFGVMPETATAAVSELVREGVLTVIRKAGRVNVYGVAA